MPQVINAGILTGLIYVLIVVGVGMISRTSGYFNMSIGATSMLAGYAAYTVSTHVANLFLMLFASIAVAFLACAFIDFGLAARIIRRTGVGRTAVFAMLVVTVSAATIMEEIVRITVNLGQNVAISASLSTSATSFLRAGQYNTIWLAIVVVGFIAGLHFWLSRSRNGLALRAVGLDREISSMMGISVPRMRLISIGISGVTTGLAGFVLAVMLSGLNPYIADPLLFTALAVYLAIGAERPFVLLLGGVAIGLIGALSSYAGFSVFSDLLSLILIVLALLARSFGLFGREFARK